jgi:hypothetical protein
MTDFELFRFTPVRPPARRTEDADPERAIDPRASGTYVDGVTRAQAGGNVDHAGARRAVARSYLTAHSDAANTLLAAAPAAAAALRAAAADGDKEGFVAALRAAVPDVDSSEMADRTWSTFYAAAFHGGPRPDLLSAALTWIRALSLLTVAPAAFAAEAGAVGQRMPRLHPALVDRAVERETAEPPAGAEPAASPARQAAILELRRTLDLLRAGRTALFAAFAKKRARALTQAEGELARLRELAKQGAAQAPAGPGKTASARGQSSPAPPLVRAEPPAVTFKVDSPLEMTAKDLAGHPEHEEIVRVLAQHGIALDAQPLPETVSHIDAVLAATTAELARASVIRYPVITSGRITWRRRFVRVADAGRT